MSDLLDGSDEVVKLPGDGHVREQFSVFEVLQVGYRRSARFGPRVQVDACTNLTVRGKPRAVHHNEAAPGRR